MTKRPLLVESEVHALAPAAATVGTWSQAIVVPGAVTSRRAQVTSVSCSSAGNCAIGGYYIWAGYQPRAFVVSEVNGNWQGAIEVPGTAAQ